MRSGQRARQGVLTDKVRTTRSNHRLAAGDSNSSCQTNLPGSSPREAPPAVLVIFDDLASGDALNVPRCVYFVASSGGLAGTPIVLFCSPCERAPIQAFPLHMAVSRMLCRSSRRGVTLKRASLSKLDLRPLASSGGTRVDVTLHRHEGRSTVLFRQNRTAGLFDWFRP